MSRARNLASIRPAPSKINWSDMPAACAARPEAAAAALAAVASWAAFEREKLRLYVSLMGGNETLVAAAYRGTGTLGRDLAIKAVAKRAAVPEELEIFKLLWKAYEKASKDRHRLAHWMWAYSPSLMDAFVLFDPADVLQEGDPSPQAKALVFSVSTFNALIEDHNNLMSASFLLGHSIGIRRSLEREGNNPPTTPKREHCLGRARALLALL